VMSRTSFMCVLEHRSALGKAQVFADPGLPRRYEFTCCAPGPAQFARAARAERTWLAMISAMMAIENQSP
jgi:hypothetical protein